MSRRICIIPARGGSKRIPKKNIKPFLGKPIIAYSIETALGSELFDEVMVSTDSPEIAIIAKKFGANVPFMRSPESSHDMASTVDVILEVIKEFRVRGETFEHGCCIYPTAPFVHVQLLKSSYLKLIKGGYDSYFPVLRHNAPIQRALKLNSKMRIEMFQPEHLESRSQDLETAYHDAGQYYWFRTSAIEEKKKLWTDNSSVELLSEMQAHDIDLIEDWKIAEFKYKWFKSEI